MQTEAEGKAAQSWKRHRQHLQAIQNQNLTAAEASEPDDEVLAMVDHRHSLGTSRIHQLAVRL